jgi:hypothetical protein
MSNATNDNDTWTRISLAALRVLTSLSASELPKSLDLCGPVDSGRFVSGVEESEKHPVIFNAQGGAPSLAFGVVTDASNSSPSMRTAVGLILGGRGLSQIAEPVIGTVPVDVVDLSFWPAAMHIEPHQTMGLIHPAANCNAATTTAVVATGSLSNPLELMFGWGYAPSEHACSRVIIQNRPKFFGSDDGARIVDLSHVCSAEVKKTEEERTEIEAGADEGAKESSEYGEDAGHCSVAVVAIDRKLALRSARVREERLT